MRDFVEVQVVRHDHGVTGLWMIKDGAEGSNVYATFSQNAAGKYSLDQVQGPWSGMEMPSDDPRTWRIRLNTAYEDERKQFAARAILLLDAINSTTNTKANIQAVFTQGAVTGWDE